MDEIVTRFKPKIGSANPIEEILLVPSSGGVFEVEVDGRQLHSKKLSGAHADPEKILGELAEMLVR